MLLAPLTAFATSVSSAFALRDRVDFQPEDQLKAPVRALLEAVGVAINVQVASVTEVHVGDVAGRPDVGVTTGGLLAGHVELKAPGKGANPDAFRGADKSQWERFKNLPNLLYTDGQSWALFRTGERVGDEIRLTGDVTRAGAAAVTSGDAERLEVILRDFLGWQPIVPSSPRALAKLLAPLCRLLRRDVKSALGVPNSPLLNLAADWRRYLFPQAGDEQFADAYAQTLTYALLLARLQGAASLTPHDAATVIRPAHRLLAAALAVLGHPDAREQLKVSTGMLERVIGAVDAARLVRRAHGGDPWLYFYEDFLAEYDPAMRNNRGVYFTPVQVVRSQVRLVARLLEDHFDAEFAFADPAVVTLDPAAGTGTYVLTAIQESLAGVEASHGPGMRAAAATNAASRVHAFEMLVGPYAVAHLRLTQQVLAEGGTLPADGVHAYLTDTLDSPYAVPPGQLPLAYRDLGEEHTRAQVVKSTTPVLVCIGNPPYDREEREEAGDGGQEGQPQGPATRRKGGWVRFGDANRDGAGILQDFIAPLGEAGRVHAKNLYNDYVYFWRWALWKVFESANQAGPGVISFITASSYLRGPGFAGMRQVMRQTFDDLWIINLEGGNLGARKTENVFAIQTPVAIAIGVRYGAPAPDTAARVHYAKLTGTQDEKLASLEAVRSFVDLPWVDCDSGWTDPFLPPQSMPFADWPLLTDIFPWQESGLQYKRSWPIAEEQAVLRARWEQFVAASAADKKRLFKETAARRVSGRYAALDGARQQLPALDSLAAGAPAPQISQIAYRSFDRQWAFIDARFGDRMRPALHVAHGPSQLYMTSLITEVLGDGPAAVATALLPDLHHFRGSFGGAHIVPLWLDSGGTQPNVTAGALDRIATALGMVVTAEDLFAYCYAVLASTGYVQSYWDDLERPGPRVPITTDAALFTDVVAVGRRLIWVHTFGERMVPAGERRGRVPRGTARSLVGTPGDPTRYPTEFRYDAATQQLHVGDGVFGSVRPEVYSFSVSGMPVVESWLAKRMRTRAGRASSPLDQIRPEAWRFDNELLDLLWVLDATIDLAPRLNGLLDQVRQGRTLRSADMPRPTPAERQGPAAPRVTRAGNPQPTLFGDEAPAERGPRRGGTRVGAAKKGAAKKSAARKTAAKGAVRSRRRPS